MSVDRIKNLVERPLPAGLIVKGIIVGENGTPMYDYEDWLRELINCSDGFMSKTGGNPFVAPVSEAHGESDACTDAYSIDFKIAVGQSLMQGLREYSPQKMVFNGVTFTSASRRLGSIDVLSLHKALRQRSKAELVRLWDVGSKRECCDDEERDISGFLKTLQKQKNLLLLHPMLLFTREGAVVPRKLVSEALYSDFKESICLRRKHYPEWESYLAYIMDGLLTIVAVDEHGWEHFDEVPLKASRTLVAASGHYDLFDYSQLDTMMEWL